MKYKYLRLVISAGFAAFIGFSVGTHAATVAYWDFENLNGSPGVNGQLIPHPSGNVTIFNGVLNDESGNANALSSKENNVSSLSSTVDLANQTDSLLSIVRAGNDAFWTQGDIELEGTPVAGTMSEWTIEASVLFTDLGGWQTIVGKDGYNTNPNDANASILYFQKMGDGSNRIRIRYCDMAGADHEIASTTAVETERWYRLAAVCDGMNLQIYVDGELEGQNLVASTNTAIYALQANTALNPAGAPYAWSVGRGMYAQGHGDLVQGYIDDVRISDTALTTSEFLFDPDQAVFGLTGTGFYPRGAGAHPQPELTALIIDGAIPLNTASVQFSINEEAPESATGVDPKVGTTNKVRFATSTPFAEGSTNDVQLTYADSSGTQFTNTWQFIVTTEIKTIPAEWGYPISLTSSGTRGFLYRDVSTSLIGVLDTGNRQAILNYLAHRTPTNDLSVNEYDFNDDGYFRLPGDVGTSLINFNVQTNANHGNFYATAPAPRNIADNMFTGLNASLPYDFATETITFLELQPGLYTLGINSDTDSQVLYMGPQPRDVNAELVKERLGTGSGDSVIYLQVDQAGLYPIRLLQASGDVPAGLELFTIDPDGTRRLVNDDANSGVRAWRVVPPTMPPAITYIDPLPPGGSGVQNQATVSVEMAPGGAAIDDLAFELWLNGQETIEFNAEYDALTGDVGGLTYTGGFVPGDANELTMVYGMQGSATRWTNSFFYYASSVPDITVVSNAPTGTGASASPTLVAVLEDGENDTLDPTTIELSLDGVVQFTGNNPSYVSKVGSATTISYDVLDTLDSGTVHTGRLVVASTTMGLGTLTNEWTFRVFESTTDLLWNINIAGGNRNVSDGVVALAPSAGDNLWNNVNGNNGQTNNFPGMKDANTGSGTTIDFQTYGSHNWGESIDAGMTVEMFQGWCGANAPMNMSFVLSNLNTGDAYDIYLYSTWRWTQNTVNYELVEGYCDVTKGSITEVQANVANAAFDDYSGCVYGENFIIFTNVSPTTAGRIRFTGQCPDGIISGLQVLQKPGLANIPPFDIVDFSPTGIGVPNQPEMSVDFWNIGAGVDTASVRLYLDDVELPPVDYTIISSASTTTVSYADFSPLDPATVYTGKVIAAANGGGSSTTNEWIFKVEGYKQVGNWNIIEDFEFYSTGLLADGNGQPPWFSIEPTAGVNKIAEDDQGKYMQTSWNDGPRGAWLDLPTSVSVAEGATGAYYFQMRSTDDTPNCYWGLSANTNGAAIVENPASVEAEMNVEIRLTGTNGINLVVTDESGTNETVLASGLNKDNWYGVWLVVDNNADTFDVYYNDIGTNRTSGTTADEAFKVGTDIAFTRATNVALTAFVQQGLGNGQADNSQEIDNLMFNAIDTGGPLLTGIYVVSNAPTGAINDPMPELAVWIADNNSTLDESTIELYLNDQQVAHLTVSDTTTKVFHVVSEALNGPQTVRLVADDVDVNTAPIDFEWSFDVPTVYDSGIFIWSNAPTAGANDIYQFGSSATDGGNVGNGYGLSAGNDYYTYVATDRGSQGQLFTTGSSNAYELASVWVQQSPVTSGGWRLNKDEKLTLRIVDPAANTNNFVLHKEELTVVTNSLVGIGQWVECKLAYPYTLDGSTQYGFDLTSYDPNFELAGQRFNGDGYTGGSAYTTGGPDEREALELGTLLPAEHDRTFLLALTPVGGPPGEGPQIIVVSPGGGVIQLAWPVGAGTFGVQTNDDLIIGPWAIDSSLVPTVMNGTNMVTPGTDAPNMNFRLIEQ